MPRESLASKTARAKEIVEILWQAYPKSRCALRYETPFQLLIATSLSAQTTDIAVNSVTGPLFSRWPTQKAMAEASVDELGKVIDSIGLWRNKAKNAVAAAQKIVHEFGGVMPQTVEELTSLPGVGRKTATAVLGTAFAIAAGVTVDTHMLRINHHLRLSRQTDPNKMASELEKIIAPEFWSSYTHRIIDHGRLVCVARRPRCGVCPLQNVCPSAFSPSIGYKQANDEKTPASASGLSWLAWE